jgi:hypothetical protein
VIGAISARAVLAIGAALPSAISSGRIAVAEIELKGPFDGATLELSGQGRTRIEGRLLAAEARVLSVPVPESASGIRLEPRVRLDRDAGDLDARSGRVRFVRWRDEESSPAPGVPPGLLARPRPPLSSADPAASGGMLACLAASLVIGLALRKKPYAALAFGVASGVLAFALGPRTPEAGAQRVKVEEGDAQSSIWLEVEAARERISAGAGDEPFRLETRPEDARIECRVALDRTASWEIAAKRALLYKLTPFSPGDRSFTRDANRWSDLDATWVREEGSWTARGAWSRGERLPDAIRDDEPPGWLVSGLPQGVPVLLGRVRSSRSESPIFVRVSGF